jgi:hypothetical protein
VQPLQASQILITPAKSSVATERPSGLNATFSRCPDRGVVLLKAGHESGDRIGDALRGCWIECDIDHVTLKVPDAKLTLAEESTP